MKSQGPWYLITWLIVQKRQALTCHESDRYLGVAETFSGHHLLSKVAIILRLLVSLSVVPNLRHEVSQGR